MKKAQHAYVERHQTVEFNVGQSYWKAQPASGPHRVPPNELSDARQMLCDAVHGFLNRSLKEGFIDVTRIDDAREKLPAQPG
jgi:hypothetical protein